VRSRPSRLLPLTEALRQRVDGERGQASVELVAALPLVLLAAAVAWQLALAGHALWLCAHAARVAARADAVGRDAEAAARSALPRSLEHGLAVRRMGGGGVRVSVRVPLLLPAWGGPVSVAASSSLGRARDD
jgi:pilus assembly protein CpaE